MTVEAIEDAKISIKVAEKEEKEVYKEIQPPTKRRRLELEEPLDSWKPPSVTTITNPTQFTTTTYHSQIPSLIASDLKAEVTLGVDEAGRGPVLGPMVYGIAYCLKEYQPKLKEYGFADSKVLKDEKRQSLFKQMEDLSHELYENVGWATTTMTAKDISSGMLQSTAGTGAYNLNEQAHDTTIELIKQVLAKGVNVTEVFVDTVGPPITYQNKLKSLFPGIDIVVTKKADSIYPIVSTASVVAKVTRDLNIQYYNESLPILQNHALGSGYPSDPNTSKWLNSNVDPVFGWCFGFIRYSWQTAKDSLVKNNAVEVIYEDQVKKRDNGYQDVGDMFESKANKSKINRSYYTSTESVSL